MSTPPLSPAVQVVLEAAAGELLKNPGSIRLHAITAAALRAATDRVLTHVEWHDSCCDCVKARVRSEFLAIANELNTQP